MKGLQRLIPLLLLFLVFTACSDRTINSKSNHNTRGNRTTIKDDKTTNTSASNTLPDSSKNTAAGQRGEAAMEKLRSRWMNMLTGGNHSDLSNSDIADAVKSVTNRATEVWSSMDRSKDRSFLWSDYPTSKRTSNITGSYNRLRIMALAYATKGSYFYHNDYLLADIVQRLDWLNTHWYNGSITLPTGKQTPKNNWWDYEIGTPLALNDIMVLLYDRLTPDQLARYTDAVRHFVQDPARQGFSTGFNSLSTGANRVWKCEAKLELGILTNNSDVITEARFKLLPVFEYADQGDGFHNDGSFVQHDVFAYTGGYGLSLYRELTKLVYLLSDSKWDLDGLPNYGNLFKWFFISFEPLVYKGAFTDMVRGREISRPGSDIQAGEALIPTATLLAQFAPASDAERLKSIVKQWMVDLHPGQSYHSSSIFFMQKVNQILNDPSVSPRGRLTESKVFSAMDRVMHYRPNFAFGISMFSNRIAAYESINHENFKGWYTGYGMTYLYTADDPHPYSNAYWPTVDPYRLPGTTVEEVARTDGEGSRQRSSSDWAGGVSLDEYTTAGMALKDVYSPLQAFKSWFMFDHEVVALGAEITDTTANPVETFIDNRQLNGNETFTVDGSAEPSKNGWKDTMEKVHWAHLSSQNIGYYFPEGETITALRQARTGSWNDINKGYSANPMTRDYLTLWVNHGTAPSDAKYAYVLLPNTTSKQVHSYADHPQVTILANNSSVQAVKQNNLNLIGANFWTDRQTTVKANGKDFLTCTGKASVMTHKTGSGLQLAVSDPTQANDGTLQLEIHQAASQAIDVDPNVTVVRLLPTIQLKIRVKGTKGRAVTAIFK